MPVETEMNGDSKSTNERCRSLVGLLGLSCRYKRFLFCLGCSSRPSTKYFFSLSQFLCTHRQQAGQAAVLGRLSISMCLWPGIRITYVKHWTNGKRIGKKTTLAWPCLFVLVPSVNTNHSASRVECSVGISKQFMGARNRVGTGLSYWPTRLHSLAELVPWNRFLGFLKV